MDVETREASLATILIIDFFVFCQYEGLSFDEHTDPVSCDAYRQRLWTLIQESHCDLSTLYESNRAQAALYGYDPGVFDRWWGNLLPPPRIQSVYHDSLTRHAAQIDRRSIWDIERLDDIWKIEDLFLRYLTDFRGYQPIGRTSRQLAFRRKFQELSSGGVCSRERITIYQLQGRVRAQVARLNLSEREEVALRQLFGIANQARTLGEILLAAFDEWWNRMS